MRLNKSIMGTLAIAAACLPTVTSCSGDGLDLPFEYLAVQESEDGNWSFYSPDGETLFKDEFKNRPSNVVDGYFFVPEGKKELYTLYKFGGRLEPVTEGLKDVGYMGDGLIPAVRENERISLLDGDGKVKFTLQPVGGKEITMCGDRYSEGLLNIAADDGKAGAKWGFVDTKGKVVIAPKYSTASHFKEGLSVVCTTDEPFADDAEFAIIDKKGEVVKKFKAGTSPIVYQFHSGRLALRDSNEHIIMVDKKGETVAKLPVKAKAVSEWDSDYIVFKDEDGKYGVMDYEGEVLVRAKYDNIQIIGSNRFLGNIEESDETKAIIFDKNGDEEMRIDSYKRGVVWAAQFGLAGIDRKTTTFIDKDGKARKNAEFANIGGIGSGTVISDYFNAEGVISDITALITDKGIDKYAIGENPSQTFPGREPQDFTYKSYVDLDDLAKDGQDYRITAAIYFSAPMADWGYDGSYNRQYYWNPNSFLYKAVIDIVSENWGVKEAEDLAKALVKKGFKNEMNATSKDIYSAWLTKGDLGVFINDSRITICQNSDGNIITIGEVIGAYEQGTTEGLATPPVSYDPPVAAADTLAAPAPAVP
ncbi:MAG: WG repeat-containing protein [Muribaculaceae bacterium]